jgi:hypothetical protein
LQQYFNSKKARAKAIIHSIAVENAMIAFTMAQGIIFN